jgi:STE24 endopeptidase
MVDRARRYARTKLVLTLADTVVSLLLMLVFLGGPFSARLAAWSLSAAGGSAPLQWLIYFGVLGGALTLIGLPLGFTGGYLVEHHYGLSTQSLGRWVREQLKGVALGILIGAPLLLGFRYLLLTVGDWWGLASGAAVFVLTILLVRIAPTVLMPLFYKFRPIENTEMVRSLREVCERAGLSLEGVYQFDMSKNTKKANAAFTGLGRTKRIILGDTLLANFPLAEVHAVVSHEVGHFRHHHLLKGIVMNGFALLAFFGGAQWVYGHLAPRLGYGPAGDLAAVPLIFMLLGIAGFLFQPVTNGLSRRFEREADRYAFRESDPLQMAAALRRLGEQNLADVSPNPWIEFFFHSHPAISKRIAAAERAAVV